jgi:hypothetical protein
MATSTLVYFPSEKEHQSYLQTKYQISHRQPLKKSNINVQILTDISYFGLRANILPFKKNSTLNVTSNESFKKTEDINNN